VADPLDPSAERDRRRRRWIRQIGTGLLSGLIAAGLVFVAVGVALPHPRFFASGVWLVTLAVLARLLLSLAAPW
jgi:hypothetical protein